MVGFAISAKKCIILYQNKFLLLIFLPQKMKKEGVHKYYVVCICMQDKALDMKEFYGKVDILFMS